MSTLVDMSSLSERARAVRIKKINKLATKKAAEALFKWFLDVLEASNGEIILAVMELDGKLICDGNEYGTIKKEVLEECAHMFNCQEGYRADFKTEPFNEAYLTIAVDL